MPGEDQNISIPSGLSARLFPTRYILKKTKLDLAYQRGLPQTIVRERPEVVVLEGTFGIVSNWQILMARRLQGLPTLYWSAGWDNPKLGGWKHGVKTQLIRQMLRLADAYITYGSAGRDYLVRHGADAAHITIAQNTIDIESICQARLTWLQMGQQLRERLGWKNRRIVAYVGGLGTLKRVGVLIEAYERIRLQLPDAALLIVGDGPELEQLQQDVLRRKLPDVHFAGRVVEGVEAYFAACDVFVMPGIGGLALNQAMALGKPVITTVADGTQIDLIEPGQNGWIAALGDVGDLTHCVLDVLMDSERASQMGRASLEIIQQRASLANMVQRYAGALRPFLEVDRYAN
jgi:glycosyltransferase involved in cell wall biosynthesis